MSEIPSDLYYTAEHEWVRRTGDDTVRVGITDFAQSALGDVVFVAAARRSAPRSPRASEFGEVESTKSDVRPVRADHGESRCRQRRSGRTRPELVNSDPYGAGWLIDLQVDAAVARRTALARSARRRTHTGPP